MKLNKLFLAALSVAALAFNACGELPEEPDGPGTGGGDTTQVNPPSGSHSIEGLQHVTVAEALAICEALDTAKSTPVSYVCEAVVSVVNTNAADVPSKYNNVNFKIKDATGEISCQYTYYLDSVGFTSADQMPAVGDTVIVSGKLKKYLNKNTNVCYNQFTNAYIYSIKRGAGNSNTGNTDMSNPMTVAAAIAAQGTNNAAVTGYIVASLKRDCPTTMTVATLGENLEFSNFTGYNGVLLADAAGETDPAKMIYVKLNDTDGLATAKGAINLADNPKNLGKKLTVAGNLKACYSSLPGVRSVSAFDLEGYVAPDNTNAPTATVATIAEFNAAAVNSTVPGVYYELTGTVSNVANTTYGNFDLTDATGTVYVYGLTANYLALSSATKANNDKSYATLGLQAGDNITIRGVRADYNGKIEVLGAYFVKKN